ncbi:AAA family ATPase [Mycobacterium sp. 663a-19]|uniref:bifunctional aminoglycoside phosphotransferase/ATP-binding protein n=1 Tax=Mycobacterium sp. 663a-19 TaxID=2986148 RepID=UPI002D1E71F1|nr:AAA family ATPase [Mycobacterium sp. 663a-19]MEB3982019.1 AAA family ATPase [Mycobacterium sp. 663a-19]
MTHAFDPVGPDGHPRIIADLLRPEAHEPPTDDLQLHETHSSWVVLAGPNAYKLKKPVDLGFLDYTSIERRRSDCDEELRLNRRFSPQVYLGVVEVTEQDGHYRIGGASGSGEPAVWMRRLPEDGMLPTKLARGEVDTRLARRIGRTLARLHRRAETGPEIDAYGGPSSVIANWQENFDQMVPFVGRTISSDINDEIRSYVDQFIRQRTPLLERRVAEGHVRDGHGDLHAASVCIDDGRIVLFDSLQFAPRYRCADLASEVAFLAMDLEYHGRADLAWAFVDSYVRTSGDRQLLSLLDFYTCYRAYVRGKVRSLRLAQTEQASGGEGEPIIAESRAYFDLAWAHAGGLPGAPMIVTMGLPASGKTTLARALAGRLGLVHLSSDVARKRMAGIEPTRRGGDEFGSGLYDPAMTRRTYAALRRDAARWLRRGRGVVVDATFGDPSERAQMRRLARRLGTDLHIVLCDADDATLIARLERRATERGVVSDARLELWPELRAAFTPPDEQPSVLRVDAARITEETTEQALALLRAATR